MSTSCSTSVIPDPSRLAEMATAARRACERISAVEDVIGEVTELWAVEPVAFDDVMIADAQAACRAVGGDAGTVVSGALHDATEIARIAPTTMVFAPSRGGLSHCPGGVHF